MFIKEIEKSDVLNIINKFKNDTATDFDKISVKLLKLKSTLIIEHLVVYILNL